MKKLIVTAVFVACLVCFSHGCDDGKKRAEAERAAAVERARRDREIHAALKKADEVFENSPQAQRTRETIRILMDIPSGD